jgi:hypothetical protein
MMRLAAGCLLAVLVGLPVPLHAQERRLAPVDEAEKDGSWTSFRADLRAAVEQRDLQYVLGVIDRDVRNGSDSPRGIEEFRARWHLDDHDTPFWRELAAALALGSAWLARDDQPRELCAPYVLGKWPRDVDPLANGVVTARGAPVKSGPSAKAKTLGTLAYVVVPVTDWEVDDSDAASKQKWVKIRLKDREGYVAEEQMRSPIEHAACFIKSESGWRLTVFGPAGRD